AAGLCPVVLGGGSSVLVGDAGVWGLVILNRARAFEFRASGPRPTVWVESGASLGALARQCAVRGLGGLEWAATVPGTVGGAVYGNAGAHGGDIAGCLVLAEILQQDGNVYTWTASSFDYAYRASALKRQPAEQRPVILSAELALSPAAPSDLQARLEGFAAHRKRTQPPGASMGSLVKTPPGDYAGRLIEAAGLKGAREGQAEISSLHANFFVNRGEARAADVLALIRRARAAVAERFGVDLELEVELVGNW